jgi:hypothetical protein
MIDQNKLESAAVLATSFGTFAAVNATIKQNTETTGVVSKSAITVGRLTLAGLAAAKVAHEVADTIRAFHSGEDPGPVTRSNHGM